MRTRYDSLRQLFLPSLLGSQQTFHQFADRAATTVASQDPVGVSASVGGGIGRRHGPTRLAS